MQQESTNVVTPDQDPTKELKREFRVFEVISLGVQVVLAFIGIGALCIYSGQLAVMRGTLQEMKQSGNDATNQMWQAVGNVNWMARSMDQSAKDTLTQMRSQSDAMKESADATKTAAGAATLQLEFSSRAWLTAEVSMDQPVTFGPAGASIAFDVNISNLGHSPALNVTIISEVINSQSFSSAAEEERLCREHATGPKGYPWGDTIFPDGKPILYRFGITVSTADLDKAFIGLGPYTKTAFLPHIVGCVDYMIGTSDTHHQTPFGYGLMAVEDSGKSTWITKGVDTQPNHLRLYRDRTIGKPAN